MVKTINSNKSTQYEGKSIRNYMWDEDYYMGCEKKDGKSLVKLWEDFISTWEAQGA
jgi:hypothetical protein